ncbi:MAG TPA: hypothetical protein PKD37_06450 [Oligoflexia bacterium]|nr:hypothetical protein [Oligoflexia bacterium]HMP27601.1 hypothetical protein [Oligoflexia bacterium]
MQDYLVRGEDPKFTYNEIKAGQSFTASLKSNLIRELGEELGAQATEMLQFQAFLPSWRETTLMSVTLPDADRVAQQIAVHFPDREVSIDDKKNLRGIYTTVKERVAVVFADFLERLEQLATDNIESKGVIARSIGWLLEVAKKTTESVETYKNFQEKYPHYVYGAHDGVRNPSTTWGLGLLLNWLMDRVIESDPYKDGGARFSGIQQHGQGIVLPPPEVQ